MEGLTEESAKEQLESLGFEVVHRSSMRYVGITTYHWENGHWAVMALYQDLEGQKRLTTMNLSGYLPSERAALDWLAEYMAGTDPIVITYFGVDEDMVHVEGQSGKLAGNMGERDYGYMDFDDGWVSAAFFLNIHAGFTAQQIMHAAIKGEHGRLRQV